MAANIVAWVAFVASRKPLDSQGWSFLELQRPKTTFTSTGSETSFTLVADGLNFALARRPIGGWETAFVKLLELTNFPAFGAALASFHSLQATPHGTSQSNSDLATAVFCIVSLAQWLGISFLLSLHREGVARAV